MHTTLMGHRNIKQTQQISPPTNKKDKLISTLSSDILVGMSLCPAESRHRLGMERGL